MTQPPRFTPAMRPSQLVHAAPQSPADAKRAELAYLQKRYGDRCAVKQDETNGDTVVFMTFEPSDPNFPFALPPLIITFTLKPQYPSTLSSIAFTIAADELPAPIMTVVISGIKRYITTAIGRAVIRQTMQWLDHNVEELCRIGLELTDVQQRNAFESIRRTQEHPSEPNSATADNPTAMPEVTQSTSNHPHVIANDTSAVESNHGIGFKIVDFTTKKSTPQQTLTQIQPSPLSSSLSMPLMPTSSTSASSSPPPVSPPVSAISSASASASTETSAATSDDDNWSVTQQAQLEAGLRKYPKSCGLDVNQRWDAIAAMVDKKTRRQCIARFKFLSQQVKTTTTTTNKQSQEQRTINAQLSHAQTLTPTQVLSTHSDRVRQQQLDHEYELEQQRKQQNASADDKKNDNSTDEDDTDDGEDEHEDVPHPQDNRISLNPQHKGSQLIVGDVELSGVATLKMSKLRVQSTCLRCMTPSDVTLLPVASSTSPMDVTPCSACALPLSMRYRAALLHENSQNFGYVDSENCEPIDVLPSDIYATCVTCFNECAFIGYQYGNISEMNCHSCHNLVKIQIGQMMLNRITHARLTVSKDTSSSSSSSSSSGKRSQVSSRTEQKTAEQLRIQSVMRRERNLLVVGQPLPLNGACAHFSKSFRWLRFNHCCGHAYPCPSCHDEAEDHESEWSTRMICGFCSKEQVIHMTCIHCGHDYSQRRAHFWEGGKGVRDQTRMNRNDSRKYAGLNKTVSKKHERVGPKENTKLKINYIITTDNVNETFH